mmetsp:Transcript_21767/g.33616  ORF Transcript_21767/g.33616 Transcript_21767/m.33616 type:complete len:90 (+) Transcript_21767:626-895(+)
MVDFGMSENFLNLLSPVGVMRGVPRYFYYIEFKPKETKEIQEVLEKLGMGDLKFGFVSEDEILQKLDLRDIPKAGISAEPTDIYDDIGF